VHDEALVENGKPKTFNPRAQRAQRKRSQKLRGGKGGGGGIGGCNVVGGLQQRTGPGMNLDRRRSVRQRRNTAGMMDLGDATPP